MNRKLKIIIIILFSIIIIWFVYRKYIYMKTSRKGVQFITEAEGFKTKAYKDSKGLWTIGVGHLINLTTEKYLLTKVLTIQEVNDLLAIDLKQAEKDVNDNIIVPLTQNEFDALVSLRFNIGNGQNTPVKIPGFKNSTVKSRINSFSDKEQIAAAFMMWKKPVELITSGRRAKEANLFVNADYDYHNIAQNYITHYNNYAA